MFIRLFVFMVFLIVGVLKGVDSSEHIIFLQEPPLKIEEAVEIANKNRPSLKAFQFSTKASEFGEKVAISGYLPQLNLTEKQQFVTGIRGWRNETFLRGSQLLYSFAGPLQERKVARKATSVAKHQEEGHWDLVRYEVEVAFLQAWLLQERYKFIKTLETAAKQEVARAENKDNVGLSGHNDWLKDATNYAQDMSTFHIYPDRIMNSYKNLYNVMGKSFRERDRFPTLYWDSEKEITLKNIQYYYQLALENRKEVKEKQKEAERQEESKKLFIKSYLPEISVFGDVLRSSGNLVDRSSTYNSTGLKLTWNLFDGAANFHEHNKANANKMKALMEKESIILQAKADVQNAYYRLSAILKALVAKRVEFVQAKNEYNLKKLRFKIGDLSKVDFDVAENNFETVKFSWLTLKVDAGIRERELHFACGYPKNF